MKTVLETVVLCLWMVHVTSQECTIFSGIWYKGGTYNEPSELVVPSALDCCQACQMDPKCVTWSWNKSRKACALKDNVDIRVGNDDYVSGGYALDEVREPSVEIEVQMQFLAAQKRVSENGTVETRYTANAVQAPIRVSVAACEGNFNTFLENAIPYAAGQNIDRSQCCQICAVDTNCLSWNWNANKKECKLNRRSGNRIMKNGYFAEAMV